MAVYLYERLVGLAEAASNFEGSAAQLHAGTKLRYYAAWHSAVFRPSASGCHDELAKPSPVENPSI